MFAGSGTCCKCVTLDPRDCYPYGRFSSSITLEDVFSILKLSAFCRASLITIRETNQVSFYQLIAQRKATNILRTFFRQELFPRDSFHYNDRRSRGNVSDLRQV